MQRCTFFVTLSCLVLMSSAAIATEYTPDKEGVTSAIGQKEYSPYAGRGFPSQVFWGDTHLHTDMSMDAGAFGNRLGIDEAQAASRLGAVCAELRRRWPAVEIVLLPVRVQGEGAAVPLESPRPSCPSTSTSSPRRGRRCGPPPRRRTPTRSPRRRVPQYH